uniref:Palmitoyl-protein thioesterase n=1 Tax=Trepomonas sp. PC1 TaxID=1076344 RepID=A0A146KGX4_9EUKA|eukprot:JAP94706.1 Palmitoyl-protein thioesterase [Trepomonas sp. PC1]
MFLVLSVQFGTPIVVMHGMGMSKDGMKYLIQTVNQTYPDSHIQNCEIGNGRIDSVMMTVRDQVDELSQCINNDIRLKDGFIAFGFSQGGYLLRNYIQNYNHIKYPALRFVGLSNPLGGFFCGDESKCYPTIQILVNIVPHNIIYTEFLQNLITASNYWRDPKELDDYLEVAFDLPLLDNLRDYDEQRKTNFMSVDKYILFGSPNDGLISPWKSAFFGQFGNNDSHILNYWERPDFNDDNFGLKTMHEQNRIITHETTFKHGEYIMPHTQQYLIDNVMPWLNLDKK